MKKHNWNALYENTPDAFAQSVQAALRETRQRQTVRRTPLRVAALALVGIVALAGVGLAVAQRTGVLDFLFPGQTEVPGITVQTAVPQAGDIQAVAVTVRDAVSDGYTIHMAVAFAPREAGDVILVDYDAARLEPNGYPGSARPQDQPALDAAKAAGHWYGVGTTMALINGYDLVTSIDWRYEADGTLVVDYVIDLRDNGRYAEQGGIAAIVPDTENLSLTLTPTIWRGTAGGAGNAIEFGEIQVGVRRLAAEAAQYEIAGPLAGEGFEIESIELTHTPLSVYATIYYNLTDEAMRGQLDSRLYFIPLDNKGNPLSNRNGGYTMDGSELRLETHRRLEATFEVFDPAELAALQPWHYDDEGERVMMAAIGVTATPIEN